MPASLEKKSSFLGFQWNPTELPFSKSGKLGFYVVYDQEELGWAMHMGKWGAGSMTQAQADPVCRTTRVSSTEGQSSVFTGALNLGP